MQQESRLFSEEDQADHTNDISNDEYDEFIRSRVKSFKRIVQSRQRQRKNSFHRRMKLTNFI